MDEQDKKELQECARALLVANSEIGEVIGRLYRHNLQEDNIDNLQGIYYRIAAIIIDIQPSK